MTTDTRPRHRHHLPDRRVVEQPTVGGKEQAMSDIATADNLHDGTLMLAAFEGAIHLDDVYAALQGREPERSNARSKWADAINARAKAGKP